MAGTQGASRFVGRPCAMTRRSGTEFRPVVPASKAGDSKEGPDAGPWPSFPSFSEEAALLARGSGPVAGIDEAGRGPWAGPVVAAAVVLDPGAIPPGIHDSKRLTPQARAALYEAILASAHGVAIGIADVARIDSTNILAATLWAMQQAAAGLKAAPGYVLADGSVTPQLPCPSRAIVRGDARCVSIAAASIVAKVTRDRLMTELGRKFPGYGFERHKGYGTAAHRAALLHLGVTEHHRRSFRPILEIEDLFKRAQ